MDVYVTTLMNAHMKHTCVIHQSELLAPTRRDATTVLVQMVTKEMVKLVSMLMGVKRNWISFLSIDESRVLDEDLFTEVGDS